MYKKRRHQFILVFVIVILVSVIGFSLLKGNKKMTEEERRNLSPEEVLREFFNSWAEKNLRDMDLFLEEGVKGNGWQLDNLKSLRLLSLENTTDHKVKNDLYFSGDSMIKHATALGYQIETFYVEFEILSINKDISTWLDGERHYSFTLIKKTENSPWEIYDYGYD